MSNKLWLKFPMLAPRQKWKYAPKKVSMSKKALPMVVEEFKQKGDQREERESGTEAHSIKVRE